MPAAARRLRPPLWACALLAPPLLGLFALLGLVLHAAWLEPLRPLLEPRSSVRVLDRFGQTLADVRAADGELSVPVHLDQISPWVVPALLAAEDARFFQHPGLDPLAMLRAAGQALRHGRVVSGGSTISQQLARTLFERPRTLGGKWTELAHALRLEAELDKAAILEAYLERVSFGPRLRGIAAAAEFYFDKPAAALSLAEAAALVALVQAPSRLDPTRFPERLERRRSRVLARLHALDGAPADAIELAHRTPLTLHRGHVLPGAFHFVRAAVTGKLGPLPRAAPGSAEAPAPDGIRATPQLPAQLTTTLDGGLQAEVERLVRGFGARFTEHRASAASVVVLDNGSAALRAYVGSPDHRGVAELGQNDGVLALRQPGSTLKPFVYALALHDLGLTPASVLSDLDQRFESSRGDYLPHNYDRRFHGPVRLGQALAASLNVPAVALAERLGPERVLQVLRGFGFGHLDEPGVVYGPAIALGVAEVQLLELAAAYSALGRGGSYLPVRSFEAAPVAAPRRVLPEAVARQILGILSDPRERAATFGRGGPLEFELPVAVKTGTSKGNRDNWVVGVSAAFTVAVWVGNFDGSPMLRSSGATGAGPLFHEVMQAAQRRIAGQARVPLARPGLEASERGLSVVCAASGQLAGPDCPHRLDLSLEPGHIPRESCSWHERRCAPGSLLASADCPVIEVLPNRYAAWAHASGRLDPGAALAPGAATSGAPPRVVFPSAGQRFVIDPRVSFAQQEIMLRAEAAADARLTFAVDDAPVCEATSPFQCPWRAERGRHELQVLTDAGASARIAFDVE
jgi:penicillin-binding protein 1C